MTSIGDHNVVKCRYGNCSKTTPLTRGMCSEHYALTVERDRYKVSVPVQRSKRIPAPPAKRERTEPYAPTATRLGRRAKPGEPQAFIQAHLNYQGRDCVLWPFARAQNGYPEMQHNGKQARAHRVICRLAHGEPPLPHFEASHTCENGHLGCVNPRHLVWESHYDNHQRRIAKYGKRRHLKLVA